MSHDTVGTWQTRELMELATFLSREVGALVRKAREGEVSVHDLKSSPTDVVTKVDLAAETRLRELLAEHRPEDAVLGEEGGTTGGSSGLTWILDPIDGTVNFLYGIPVYAVSVAVVAGPPEPGRWTQVAGAVTNAAEGRTWWAGRGLGAWYEGERVHVNAPAPLAQSLVGTGFAYEARVRRHQAQVLGHLLDKVRDLRRGGSCALDLCAVASGRLDAFFETGTKVWDFAAGSLVVREAGGVVRGLGEDPEGTAMVIAGPAETVDALDSLLREAGAGAVL
jgi:Archaeal fructose-1,6-bisphosphatase and related enzymes of inositol monophosphatase family